MQLPCYLLLFKSKVIEILSITFKANRAYICFIMSNNNNATTYDF